MNLLKYLIRHVFTGYPNAVSAPRLNGIVLSIGYFFTLVCSTIYCFFILAGYAFT